jgi:hypothetical protein
MARLTLLWQKNGRADWRQFDSWTELDVFEQELLADGWEPDPKVAAADRRLHHQAGDYLEVMEADGSRFRASTAPGMGCRVWGRIDGPSPSPGPLGRLTK